MMMNKEDDITVRTQIFKELYRDTNPLFFQEFDTLPVISVITVVYNAEQYLERAINSVINQNYPYLEYIVVDGGSTDSTINIIKRHEENIEKWISEPDKGIYEAMNKASNLSTGDYLIFLNADDYFIADDVLSKAILQARPTTDCICGSINFIDENANILYSQKTEAGDRFSYLMHQAFLYKKSLHRRFGLYETAYKINADYDFYQRIFSDDINFVYTEMIFSNMTVGGFSNKNKLLSAVETLHIQLKYNLSVTKAFKLFLIKIVKIKGTELLSLMRLKKLILLYKRAGTKKWKK